MRDRFKRAQSELNAALNELVPGETFGIVAFDQSAYAFDKQLMPATPANIARARQFLEARRLEVQEEVTNGTNLQLALRKALQTRGVNVVVVITDGEPTVGETDHSAIAAKARSQNKAKARIDAIGLVGRDANGDDEGFDAAQLLEQIARESGGQFKEVKDDP